MAIALRTAGTPTGTADAANNINPALPTGWTAGDIALLWVACRPSSVTFPSTITPGGGNSWTKLFEGAGGDVTFGVDTGTSRVACYIPTNLNVAPVAPGVISIGNLDANSSAGAVIHLYSKTLNSWDLTQFTAVSDDTQSTNYNATVGGADINLVAANGDLLAFCEMFSSDGGTISAETIAVTGVTMGVLTIRGERAISTGHDSRLRPGDNTLVSGTSSAKPNHAYTNLQGGSGVTAFLRLREVDLPPAIPTSVAISTKTQTSLKLDWAVPATNPVPTSYEVRKDGGAATDVGNVFTNTFNTLASGTSFNLEVRSKNSVGTSAWVSAVASTISADPTGLVVGTKTSSSLQLSWNAVTGATGYDVRVNGGASTDIGNVLTNNFTGLSPNTAYTLEVRSHNASGNSGWSTIIDSTLSAGPPPRLSTQSINDYEIAWLESLGYTTQKTLRDKEMAFLLAQPGIGTAKTFNDLQKILGKPIRENLRPSDWS